MINERQHTVFVCLQYCLQNPFFIVPVVKFILLTFRVCAVCLQIHLEPTDIEFRVGYAAQ
jgi:hypothetical protein